MSIQKSSFRQLAVAAAISTLAISAQAQSFLPGNLLVSRTVYSGTSSLISVGQALPGGGTAVADGSFPNVFKNESTDASFGVTSAIYIDQITRSGSQVSTVAIDPSLMTTSFASKSELALNLSADGTSVTFMGYKAPVNTLDVSNSNTTAAYDSTNPVTSTYQRAIGQLNADGTVSVVGVNAYSGNNGRAVVSASGAYYMVGNAGNSGSGVSGSTLTSLSNNTGVQMIANGASGNTTVVGAINGTAGSTTGYQRGFSTTQLGYAADKTGKDDNFRGLTMFNNTLFVTKGSGGNGVNTVYQVGATGQLPTLANAGSTTFSVLAGFPTGLAKTADASTMHPFGLWFGDASTLFVADEGDGVRIGDTKSTKYTNNAGLQEWKFDGAKWNEVAVFQKGLLDQPSYKELQDGSSGDWNVFTDGLRNITGQTNADGSYDIWGTTSTTSDELTHDLGADRNEIVHCHITSASTASNTGCDVVSTADTGARFGGLSMTPMAAVPEPESYALAVLGLGLIGWTRRRVR